MFDLTNAQINALISKMILNDELKASWDKPTELLMLHRAESSKLQSLAKQTADKVCLIFGVQFWGHVMGIKGIGTAIRRN